MTNMFPNAGFEWGTRGDGIPLGQKAELYGAAPGSLQVRKVSRNGLDTLALASNNSPENPQIALEGFFLVVDPNMYYLMAGWLWDEAGFANIGRNCVWEGGGMPYYIAYDFEPRRPRSTWVHVADLNVTFPGHQPTYDCEVLLININKTKSTALWDDILWIPLLSP